MSIPRKKAYLGIVAFALFGGVARYAVLPQMPWEFHAAMMCASFAFLALLWEGVGAFARFLDRALPYSTGVKRRVVVQIAVSIVAFSVVEFLLVWLSLPLIRSYLPINVFTPAATMVAYVANVIGALAINLTYIGRYFFEQWKEELLRAERLGKERALAQFDNLKNQLNPHFLFNALTSLNSLIFENQQLASEFVQHLSKVYRYVLHNQDKELVSLSTEIAFIRHYAKLLQTRFGEALRIEFRLSDDALERRLVPVSLQILIENAVKHNIVNTRQPLVISVYDLSEGGATRLCVENNLQRKQIVENSNKVGLRNFQSLYGYLSPEPVEIIETVNTFCLSFPLL